MSQIVGYVLQLTSLPVTQDLAFLQRASRPMVSYTRTLAAYGSLGSYMSDMDEADDKELFVQMLNQGNLLEIQAEYELQVEENRVNSKWRQIAGAVLSVLDVQRFSISRIGIMANGGANSTPDKIDAAKAIVASLYDASPTDISFDSLSYKVPMSLPEHFALKYPVYISQLSGADYVIMAQVQERVMAVIKEKCAEFRQRSETYEDEFYKDHTLFLELSTAGKALPQYNDTLLSIGVPVLEMYLDQMQGMFVTGNLPGALPPIRIYACHDYPSTLELSSAISSLAEKQVVQQEHMIDVPYTALAIRDMPGDGQVVGNTSAMGPWQKTSVQLKHNSNVLQKKVGFSVNEDKFNHPQKILKNQLEGGRMGMRDQLDFQVGGGTAQHTEEGKELIKQQLSVLLACIRARLDAIQESETELVSQDDFNHLELIKVLSNNVLSVGGQELFNIASVLQTTYSEGHNRVKYSDKILPQELVNGIVASLEGQVQGLVRSIPMFERDLQMGGTLMGQLLNCALKTCAFQNRWELELKRRKTRRNAMIKGVQQIN